MTTGKLSNGNYYYPATTKTIVWGYLPNRNSKASLAVPSGSTIIFDCLSGEGIMEDQGRNPVKFFQQFGVKKADVLDDAVEIAASDLKHDFDKDGPHIILGPVSIDDAMPGDVLKVEMLSFLPRVPYGLICNLTGGGALPGEYPPNKVRQPGTSSDHPELFNDEITFVPLKNIGGKIYGVLQNKDKQPIYFPFKPFVGTIGVGADTNQPVNSIPPSTFGGNLDLNEITAGSTLYLPIQIPGAMFFVGDPHFAQGDGEVAATAVEGSLRAKFKLTLLKKGDKQIPAQGQLHEPFAETEKQWIILGMDPNLDQAMKKAVRSAILFLCSEMNMDAQEALAYLSAASDFKVTQVVDKTKEIHACINKRDFVHKKQSHQ